SAASSENSTRNASRSFLFHQSLKRDGLSRPDLSARLEDILDGLHAQAVFQGASDRIPDEFGLRREALFLGCRREQLRLFFREFEADCLHTNCNTLVLLNSTDGLCEHLLCTPRNPGMPTATSGPRLVDRLESVDLLEGLVHRDAMDDVHAVPLDEAALNEEVSNCLDILGLHDRIALVLRRDDGPCEVFDPELVQQTHRVVLDPGLYDLAVLDAPDDEPAHPNLFACPRNAEQFALVGAVTRHTARDLVSFADQVVHRVISRGRSLEHREQFLQ